MINYKKFLQQNYYEISLALFSAIGVLVILYHNVPFPLLLNWDIYEHQNLINLLGKGYINYFTSNISDTFTFNSYPPTFHILLLVLQKIFFVSSLNSADFWYVVQIFYYLFVVIAQGLIAYQITKNKSLAAIVTLIGIFEFESFGAYTSLFLLPQTLTSLMFILLFTKVIQKKVFSSKLKWASLAVLLPFFHYIIGTLAVITLIGYLITVRFFKVKTLKIFIVILLLATLISIIFYSRLQFNPLSSREESFDYLLPLSIKLFHLQNWYGYFFYIFAFIGLIKALLSRKASYVLPVLIGLVYLFSFIFPFPYNSKFWVIGRYFINIWVGIGFFTLYTHLKSGWQKKVALAFLTLTLGFIFYHNQLWYKNIPNNQGGFTSHYSPSELKASEFLRQNYKYDVETLMISDPSTQYILESFSEVNSQGGSYMLHKNRRILMGIANTKDINRVVSSLFAVKDEIFKTEPKTVIFVLSGRYFAWQQMSDEDKLKFVENVWYPLPLQQSDLDYIEFLKQDSRFKEVYKDNEMVILEVQK